MNRYYDHKCVDCFGCALCQPGEYPNGTPYEACRHFGYILHPDKGISEEHCPNKRTPEQYAKELEQRKLQEEQKKKKYKRK